MPFDVCSSETPKPRTRGECAGIARPCPFVRCRYHLALEIDGRGRVRLRADLQAGELSTDLPSCALDVADDGPLPPTRVAEALAVTHQRVAQIEADAGRRFAMSLRRDDNNGAPIASCVICLALVSPGQRYCSDQCLSEAADRRRNRRRDLAKAIPGAHTRACACGATFERHHGNMRYCSPGCPEHPSNKPCKRCGKRTGDPSRNYCSNECKAVHRDAMRPRCRACKDPIRGNREVVCRGCRQKLSRALRRKRGPSSAEIKAWLEQRRQG